MEKKELTKKQKVWSGIVATGLFVVIVGGCTALLPSEPETERPEHPTEYTECYEEAQQFAVNNGIKGIQESGAFAYEQCGHLLNN